MKNFKELFTLIPFVVGIAILLNLLVYQGMEVIYPEPMYEDFCTNRLDQITHPTKLEGDQVYTDLQITDYKNQCITKGGLYESSAIAGELGYCDFDYTCRVEYEKSAEQYSLIVMSVLLIIGVLLLMTSRQFSNKAVELGFSYAGVFMMIGSLGRLWQVGSQASQLIAILIALGGLLYFANQKLRLE